MGTPGGVKKRGSQTSLREMEAGGDSGMETDSPGSSRRAEYGSGGRPPLPPSRAQGDVNAGIKGDELNMALLVLLYMLQGVPLGLSMGSIPFLLKAKASFTQIGLFSLAAYPYSFKLLWSPIVDSVYSSAFGRRKSWIVPIQACSAFIMISWAAEAERWVAEAHAAAITALFFGLVLLAATQDIAVDGWALELLARRNLPHTSTCQTLGMNIGYFLSFTVFLALSDGAFCTQYLCHEACPDGIVQLGGYLRTWGWVYLAVTIGVALLKKEVANRWESSDQSISESYLQLWSTVRLPAVRRLGAVLVTSRLGVIAVESVGPFKLMDKGVLRETISMLVLLQFPVELIFAVVAGRWASTAGAHRPWVVGWWARSALALLTTVAIAVFPHGASPSSHPLMYGVLVALAVATSMSSTLMFVSSGTLYAKISDPAMGGAYLTLLNTIANMGVILPKLGVFYLVDYFTSYSCVQIATPRIHLAIPCSSASTATDGDDACTLGGGACEVAFDGFYGLAVGALLLSLPAGLWYSRAFPALEALPLDCWRAGGRAGRRDSHKL